MPTDPGDFFVRFTMGLIILGVGIALVAAIVGWSIGLVRGALHADREDLAATVPLPDLAPRSVVPPSDRHRSAPLLRDVRTDFAWLAPPERSTNGDQQRVAPARARKDR